MLEQSKEHRANMQKMYDAQCGESGLSSRRADLMADEAQRLRDILRERDSEIRNLEESVAEHEADEEKVSWKSCHVRS